MYTKNNIFSGKDNFISLLLRSAVLVMALLSTFSTVWAQ